LIGVLSAAALLLAAAGLAKLRQRAPVRSAFVAARVPVLQQLPAPLANRLSGAAELVIGLVALALGGRFAAIALGVTFLVLAGLSARMMAVESGQDCGCFSRPSPVTHWHTAVNLSCALLAGISVISPADSLLARFGAAPFTSLVLLGGGMVLAYAGYLCMTALPELLSESARLEAAR
jgi:hypothetical protein